MSKNLLFLFALSVLFIAKSEAQVTVSGANTGNGTYGTLGAAITAIGTSQAGANVLVTVTAGTTETGVVSIGAGTWTSLTIRPSGGSWTITGAVGGGALIDLNGADNVTIDGLNTGGNALTIQNTSNVATSGTSTIRFLTDATNNTITNCSILGSSTVALTGNGGTIFFSTGTTTGNDNNTISNCNIGPAGSNLPTKVIYGNGTTTNTAIGNSGIIINNNNIFDYFSTTAASSGIYTNGGCNTWSITNNRFYQTGTRTWTTGALHTPININPTTTTSGAQGFTITGNIIGYASSTQTGTYTLTGSTGSFMGIRFNGITGGTVSNINSNTIASVSLTGVTSSGTGTSSPFAAIMIPTGNVNTNSNTIGSQSATGSLVYSTNTTGSNDVYGIYNFGSDSWTASSNNIGGISFTNAAASGSHIFYGLRANTGTGVSFTANSNNIGGTIANSIQLSVTGTGSEVVGIYTGNAAASFTGNTIRNLTTSAGTGTASAAGALGIGVNSTTASNLHTVSNNTIYNLTNSFAGAATVNGIFFAGPSLANIVERNFIYDLNAVNASAIVNGIYLNSGTATYKNNMIRLGTSGSTATVGMAIAGIFEIGGTDNFYHNSIYIGGAPASGSANSFAFQSSVTSTRAYQNNIFWNARSNSGSTGKHYAISAGGTATPATGLTSSYNDLYVTGTGGNLGLYNGVDRTLATWRTVTGQDGAGTSFSSDPQFIAPAAATPDLHIHATNPTSVEAGGTAIGSVTDDFDGQVRSGFTPVDIGADAGNFTGQDISAPNISYSAITNSCGFGDITLSNVTITDATGVATSGTLRPRVYYRKGAGSWFSQPGTLSSGSGTNGTWTFTMLASDMGGLATNNTVSYYVIAQDGASTPNIGSSPSTGLSATDVNTVATPPTTPNSLTVKPTLGGVYTVGSGGAYTTLTAAVTDYNAACLTDSVTFSLIDNAYAGETYPITISANSYASATFRLIIKPAVTKTPVFSASVANPLFDLSGAKYVKIDGSNTVAGTTKDLTITNNNANNAAIRLINDATNNLIKNAVIQGSSGSSASAGVIYFANTSGTTGNDDNVVSNCDITNGASTPANAIYSLGSTASTPVFNSGNTITGCNISNYFSSTLTSYGVFLSLGNTDWTISNNKFFQTAQRNFTAAVNHRPIYINSTTAGNNFSITGNTIGFANASGTGTYDLTTAASSFTFTGIDINAAATTASNIQGNTISGISINTASSGSNTSSPGTAIIIESGLVNIGNLIPNTIGSLDGSSGITFTTSSTLSTDIYAILNYGSSNTNISNNNIGKITASAGASGNLSLYGIHVFTGTAQTATISGNTIGSSLAPLTNNATGTAARVLGISNTNTIGTFNNNQISYLTTAAPNTSTGTSASVIGILINSSPNSPETFSGNKIFALSNTHASSAVVVSGMALYLGSQGGTISGNFIHSLSVSNATAIINGIDIPGSASGNGTFSNNMIRLGIDASGSGINVGCAINGVNEGGTTANTSNFYFNSIYIGGAPTAGAANTFALKSTAITNTRRYQNNILFNARSNSGSTGKHYAMQVGGTAANPAGLTTNYNDLVANGTGGFIGLFNSVDRTDIASWRTATGQDANSFTYDPQYIASTGDVATVDLHIQASPNPTPIEARGTNVPAVTLDYDGQARASFTPEDIGADAGNFTQAALTPVCAGTLAPTTGTNQSTTVSLSWAAVSGVTGYDVYWSTNQTDVTNEAGAALVSSNQAGTSYVTAGSVSNTYYWKVVSRNVAGTSPSCTVMNYNTNVPNCPTLVSPANAATGVCPAAGNLTWSAPGSGITPTGYKLYLGTDGGGVTTPTDVVNGTNLGNVLTYAFSSLAANTTYYWQIVSVGVAGDAASCAIRSFSTGAAATIETQTPIADDFEYCSEWTLVNDASHKWIVGSATNNGGTKSIYISNDNGTTNAYGITTAQTSHFYRDVTFPAGQTNYTFTFDLKGSGESSWDRVLVYIAPTSTTPSAGSPVSNSTTITGATLLYTQSAFNTSYAQVSVPLNSGQVGNASANSTRRIIFTWQNDNSSGTQTPAAIDNISITSSAPTPPNCATLTAPANGATNVCAVTGNLTWTAPGSGTAPTGYKLYFGTDGNGVSTPTNVVNGTNLGNVLTYAFSSLSGNTVYYWQIVPTAGAGDASGCAIRSFTTGAATIETTTPISDDFEYCQEWTIVNGATNKWIIGTATNNGGSKGIYVSNDNGTTNAYSGTSQTCHFYRDVLFPSGETIYSFTFDLKGSGEVGFDRLLVYIAPTGTTPVSGTPSSSSTTLTGATLIYTQTAFQATYTQINVPLTSTQVGNASANSTRRIIFTWQNDGSGQTQPPAAIDNISITSAAPAPLAYSSSTVIQPVTSAVVANTLDNQVVGVRITVTGATGTLDATSITLNPQGTATTADIENAKLWWTGASASFAATTQVGSTIASPSGALTFNFTQALAAGDNYFWLSYDILSGATSGRTVDAVGITNGVTVGGNTYTPSTLNPTGSRTILVPLCGTTYTINNTLPTAGLNYNSFTDAINDLNTVGTGCAVVFNVKDGQTFNELPPIITATGTAIKTITFQRDNSTGTRPALQGTNGTTTADAVIQINSGDYFTFDGINIKDNPANGNANAKMEYGVYLLGSTGNGCRNNTVKNATITMNFVSGSSNTNTRGVFVSSAPTSTGGTCDRNSFYNNTVENAVNGYLFNNSTAIYDTLNQVGIINAGSSTIQNIGLAANVTAFGVGAEGQFNFKLANTKINNVTSADLAFGFYNATIRSSVTINGCRITNVNGNEVDNIAAVRLSNTNSTLVAYDDTINTISNTLAASSSAAHAFYLNSGKKKVYNCIIGGSASTKISSLSGDASAFYIINGTSSVIDSIYNNTVSYIDGGSANSSNTGYGIRSTHNASYFAGNNFSNITALYNVYGIAVSDISDVRIYDNVIATLTTSTTNNSAVGINATSPNNGTVRIYRNKVSGVSAGTAITGATAYGIQVNPSNGTVTAEVVNNMVSDIRANNANSGTTCSVAGIRFGPNGGASHVGRFYFNTVYLNGTGANSALQTAAFATNTNSNVGTIELISNIFYNNYNVNTGANASAIWATGSLATYAGKLTAASNNNFLYAGTPGTKHYIFSGTTGTTDLTTALSAYKSGVGGSKESASLTGTLNFVSTAAAPYDLHISPTTSSCAINGAGKAVAGVTSDIDNDVRCDAGCTGSTIPDIGADEFDCLLVWTGNVSTVWDNPLNWMPNVVPDQTINVLIPDVSAGSNRYPVLVGTPTTFETKDITINAGASVTLSFSTTAGVPQADLTVYGAFVNNGAADMGYGSLAIKTGSSISGAITTGYLKIDGNVSLNLGAVVQVKRELALKSGTLTTTGGTLTLKSDATSTGYVNDFGSNSGSLVGNLTIERYIPSGAVNDFHYIGSAIGGSVGIWSDDFGNTATPASDNVPVTPKSDCDPLHLASTSAYGSLFSYDQSLVTSCYLSGWRVRTTAAAAARGNGFAAKITTGVVLDETGAYNKTNVTLSNLAITAANAVGHSKGYHLVSNPFFAPVDWNAMATLPANSNMDGTAYIYNPNSGTYGAYNQVISGSIPTNLGFFVRGLTGASFNVTFDATTRIAGTNSNFLRQGKPYEYGLKITATTGTRADETFIAFDKNFTDSYDNGFDANKLLSSYGVPSLYTMNSGNERRAIEAVGISNEIKSIPLGLLIPGAGGNYTFTFDGVQDFPATTIIWLEDLQTGAIQFLRQNQSYSFVANESDNPDRFVLHFSPELLVSTTGADCSGNNGTITLEQRGGIEWSVRLTDVNNSVVASDVFTTTDVVDQLAPGMYTLKLTHAASGYATTLTVDVNGLQTVVAGITTSATQVFENESLTVEAQTTGGTGYMWTMGDGTTITGQQTVNYSYAQAGTYEVTLFASNDECSATTKINVTVSKQDTVNTGVHTLAEGKLTVYESNDVLFITQTISKTATARVTIYNALGQVVVQDDVKELSYKASYQLPVRAAAGVYYAHVELATGERLTIKMMLGE